MERKQHIFEFDDVRIDSSEFRAWKADVELALEPKTFDVLLFLLENRGRLIEKTELLDAVWHDTYVTENAMTREIAKVRKALGDGARTAKYIKTIHTRGYCFVADVREGSNREKTVARPVAAGTENLSRKENLLGPAGVVAAACGLLALLAVALLAFWAIGQ